MKETETDKSQEHVGHGDRRQAVSAGRQIQNVRCHREVRGSEDRGMETGFGQCRLQMTWREKAEGGTWLQTGQGSVCPESNGNIRPESSVPQVWAVKTDRQTVVPQYDQVSKCLFHFGFQNGVSYADLRDN